MRHSASMYSVTLKTGLGVVQGHRKWRRSIDHIWLSIGRHCKYSSIWYRFWVIWHWMISWPWNLGYRSLKNRLRFVSHDPTLRALQICLLLLLRSFKPVPFVSLGAVSYSPSVVTMVLSCIVCEMKRDIGRKSWFLHTPMYSAPPLGRLPSEYCYSVWCGKTRMVGLPDGEKTLRIV